MHICIAAAYALSSKENSGRKSLQQFSPCALPAEPWEGQDGHAVPADCLGELFGGAAMTRRRRLRYTYIYIYIYIYFAIVNCFMVSGPLEDVLNIWNGSAMKRFVALAIAS